MLSSFFSLFDNIILWIICSVCWRLCAGCWRAREGCRGRGSERRRSVHSSDKSGIRLHLIVHTFVMLLSKDSLFISLTLTAFLSLLSPLDHLISYLHFISLTLLSSYPYPPSLLLPSFPPSLLPSFHPSYLLTLLPLPSLPRSYPPFLPLSRNTS